MPFLHFETGDPNLVLGLWRLEENEIFFLTQLKLYEHEWQKLGTISHPQKRLEWLSSRLCLKEILKISHRDRIESLNQVSGKPYLSNNSHFISYSHSHKYAAAIASQKGEVGIDLEYLERKRNPKTRRLFMNEAELAYYEANPTQEVFLTIWSAKETLYKIVSQKGVSFKEHMFLQLDDYTFSSKGILPAKVIKDGVEKEYSIHYVCFPDFILTYGLDEVGPMEAESKPKVLV